jgi:hypothetical protein
MLDTVNVPGFAAAFAIKVQFITPFLLIIFSGYQGIPEKINPIILLEIR